MDAICIHKLWGRSSIYAEKPPNKSIIYKKCYTLGKLYKRNLSICVFCNLFCIGAIVHMPLDTDAEIDGCVKNNLKTGVCLFCHKWLRIVCICMRRLGGNTELALVGVHFTFDTTPYQSGGHGNSAAWQVCKTCTFLCSFTILHYVIIVKLEMATGIWGVAPCLSFHSRLIEHGLPQRHAWMIQEADRVEYQRMRMALHITSNIPC